MTIREKLKEVHEWIQKSYCLEEIFFGANLLYQLDLMYKIMTAYTFEFSDHSHHVKNEHQKPLEIAVKNCREITEKNNATLFVQNKYLNVIKSNETNAYWLFVQFIDGQRNGFFEKSFTSLQLETDGQL